jgi:hypothetical protein
MTLRPEQIKAKQYMRDKGTLLSAPQIHERVAAAFSAVEDALGAIDEAQARQRPLPGEWTVHEVVDHLVETHRPSLAELRDLLDNRRPAGGPVPPSLQSADPMRRPHADLLADLKALHREALATLSSASDRLTDARAPIVMVVNAKEPDGSEVVVDWIEELDWKAYAIVAFRLHEIDHLNQVKKTLKAARTSEPERTGEQAGRA